MSVLDLFRLDGKVAIVTGASSGLGVAFADGLAEAGADIAICARRADRLQATKERVEAHGRRCVAIEADVSEPEDCERVVAQTVAELGKAVDRKGAEVHTGPTPVTALDFEVAGGRFPAPFGTARLRIRVRRKMKTAEQSQFRREVVRATAGRQSCRHFFDAVNEPRPAARKRRARLARGSSWSWPMRLSPSRRKAPQVSPSSPSASTGRKASALASACSLALLNSSSAFFRSVMSSIWLMQ